MHMALLIVVFLLLFLLLLLSMPLIVEARIRLGVRGAVVRAKVYVLGLFPIPLRMTVHLFSKPYFTLRIGKKQLPLFGGKRPGRELGLLKGTRFLRLDSKTTVGIEDDPAHAVLLAGTGAVLLSMLTTRFFESGSASAALSSASTVRWTLSIRTIVFSAEALFGVLSHKANNTAKSGKQ